MSDTLVLQSHRDPLPNDWLATCLTTVREWANWQQFDYRFMGDEIFESVPVSILEKTRTQRVVTTDLARLHAIREYLSAGYSRVIWCDADLLVINPEALTLTDAPVALGREVWIENEGPQDQPRAYIKVHNAFMQFTDTNTFLDFYIDSATRMLRMHEGRFVPQFIGPKLLTALHNIVHFDVIEPAGMLSPAVVRDLVIGGGPSLDLLIMRSPVLPAAVNLCSSLAVQGSLLDAQMPGVIKRLLGHKSPF